MRITSFLATAWSVITVALSLQKHKVARIGEAVAPQTQPISGSSHHELSAAITNNSLAG